MNIFVLKGISAINIEGINHKKYKNIVKKRSRPNWIGFLKLIIEILIFPKILFKVDNRSFNTFLLFVHFSSGAVVLKQVAVHGR